MKSAWFKWAMSILVGAAALWGTVLAEDSAEIAGVVVDELGAPLAGARISVLTMQNRLFRFKLRAKTTTDQGGRFSLGGSSTGVRFS